MNPQKHRCTAVRVLDYLLEAPKGSLHPNALQPFPFDLPPPYATLVQMHLNRCIWLYIYIYIHMSGNISRRRWKHPPSSALKIHALLSLYYTPHVAHVVGTNPCFPLAK